MKKKILMAAIILSMVMATNQAHASELGENLKDLWHSVKNVVNKVIKKITNDPDKTHIGYMGNP